MKDELLIRYIKCECPEEEAREILRWIETTEANKAHFKQLYLLYTAIALQDQPVTELPDKENIERILNGAAFSNGGRKKHSFYWMASALITSAAVLLFLFLLNKGGDNKDITVSDYEACLAGTSVANEIVLTLEKDKPIRLQDSSAVVSYKKKQHVRINDEFEILQEKQEVTLNTIRVPYGKRSLLILADGTKVHLNSGSSLVYPSLFTDRDREVYLDGEAYFEVQKEQDGRKFIVRTAYKKIEVTGTEFNVLCDKNIGKFETVLVNGKISVDSEKGQLQLFPNQYYDFTANTRNEILKDVDVSDYISWIDGKLKFSREPLHTVLYKLEKVYNLKITLLVPEYRNYLVSGVLDLKNSGRETLDILMKILTPGGDNLNLYRIDNE